MNMQDKDIDALFGSKLKYLEVEPSAKVWKGITLELDGVKHKNKALPVLRIAVSIMIFLGIGLFFLFIGDKTPVYTANNIGEKQKPIKEIIDGHGNKMIAEETPIAQRHVAEQPINNHNVPQLVKRSSSLKINSSNDPQQTMPEIIVNDQSVLTAAENTTLTHLEVSDLQLVTQHDVTANDKFISAANNEVPDMPVIIQKARKHGIRTLGDLINVVVAKVDKREDKVIEFSNTDDDGSVVSGVNLGIVKIKRDK